jgi:membrane-bound metal-dependent hydrolase YbcI (DUF457 family)
LFAVGHLALGYILGRASTRRSARKLNVPLVLALSIIPDADILLKSLGIEHRGPTHSIVILSIVFIPIFLIYHKKAIPYFVATVSHPLVGDLLIGGSIGLLWPLSTQYFGLDIPMGGPADTVLEWSAFVFATIVMLRIDDIKRFFQAHLSNLVLSIPAFTVLLPSILGFPLGVPTWLEPPHVALMILFATAIIITLARFFKSGFQP